ncbi:hypothetical protein B0T24DRAFT_377748 [Lasiosphaeria ovina]|uniref:Uncharacterized protein n=1 Tax=Lasiosphaeria ovina TaxID=92902 RepID=A0AAE0JZS8_9PEZI|nr:hypothetical protein B0T24DRAFT_377748 [Lasiosphaeria ovina]
MDECGDKHHGPVSFIDDGSILLVEGWQVGVVSATAGGVSWGPIRSNVHEMPHILRSTIPRFEALLDEASLLNRISKQECREEWLQYAASVGVLSATRNEPGHSDRVRRVSAIYAGCLRGEFTADIHDASFLYLWEHLGKGHFVTESGMLGCYDRHDNHPQSGDMVCLIKGSLRPLILRRQEKAGYYTLVSTGMLYAEPAVVNGQGLTSYEPTGNLEEFRIV